MEHPRAPLPPLAVRVYVGLLSVANIEADRLRSAVSPSHLLAASCHPATLGSRATVWITLRARSRSSAGRVGSRDAGPSPHDGSHGPDADPDESRAELNRRTLKDAHGGRPHRRPGTAFFPPPGATPREHHPPPPPT